MSGYSDTYSDLYAFYEDVILGGVQLPTIPSLPAGHIVTADEMNDLVNAAEFLYQKPICRIHDGAGGQSIPNGSYSNINFNTADINNNNMWSSGSPSRITIQTQGWYKIRYAIQGGSGSYTTSVYLTTGPDNPQGSGLLTPALATVDGGWYIGYGLGQASSPGVGASVAGGIWPTFLYIGDYLQVQVSANGAGAALDKSVVASWFSAEYVSI